MKKIIVMFVSVFVLITVCYAIAASPQYPNTNKDGQLDMKELDAAAVKVFKKHDRNGDGYLDKSEFMAIEGTRSRFEDLDANRDGKLNMSEIRDAASRKYDLNDKNRSGPLDDLERNEKRLINADPMFHIYF
jgi:Ca2+-binding EF-hand superfamily protein